MSLKFLSILIGVCVSLNTLSALHFDDKHSLRVNVSSKGLTRLSFDGDKIVDLFVYPGEYQENLSLHKSGNLFISPGEGTFHVTLLSLSGVLQDFTFTYSSQVKAQPITLSKKPLLKKSPQEERLPKILQSFLGGDIPDGFTEEPYKEEALQMDFEGVTLKVTGCFKRSNTLIYEGVIQNITKETIFLKPNRFKGLSHVALSKDQMVTHERLKIYFLIGEGVM